MTAGRRKKAVFFVHFLDDGERRLTMDWLTRRFVAVHIANKKIKFVRVGVGGDSAV